MKCVLGILAVLLAVFLGEGRACAASVFLELPGIKGEDSKPGHPELTRLETFTLEAKRKKRPPRPRPRPITNTLTPAIPSSVVIKLQEAADDEELFSSSALYLYDDELSGELAAMVTFQNVKLTAGTGGGTTVSRLDVGFTAESGPEALFLKLPGIPGEAAMPGYSELVEIDSFTLNARTGTITIVKVLDKTSPKLMEALTGSFCFVSPSFLVYSTFNPSGPPNGIITFESVVVESIDASQDPDSGEAIERVTFRFTNVVPSRPACLPGNTLCPESPMTKTSYEVAGYSGSRLEFDVVDPLLASGDVVSFAWMAHGQVDGLYPEFPTTIAATLDGAGRRVVLGRIGIDGGWGTDWIWDVTCSAPCIPGKGYPGLVLPAWDGDVAHIAGQSYQIVPVPHDGWSHSRFPTSGYTLLPTDRPQVPNASCVDTTLIPTIPWDPGCGGPCTRTQATCSDNLQGGGLTRVFVFPPGKARVTIETFGEVTPPVTFYIQFPYEQPDIANCPEGRCRSVYPPVQNTFVLTVN